jgi:release factor glutamine methyltransferase
MLTVLEALKLSDEYLQKYKIESSRLNAELLLAEVLQCKRLDLYLLYDKPLSEGEIIKYREYLKRRSKREPLQYIIGYVDFFGLKFFVNPSVLIPRPETEILVESVMQKFSVNDEIRILDIGIGSGNMAVSLLKNLVNSEAVGIDISEESLSMSKRNAVENSVESRLELIKFDILKDDYNLLGKFDLIISNPPYVSQEDYNELEPELKVFEPVFALTDYSDGYSFYEKIIPVSKDLFENHGKLFFELGKGQHNKVKNLMEKNGFININITQDYSRVDRIIYGEI